MRIGGMAEMHRGTDLGQLFGGLREMGMESCQLVCWEPELLNKAQAELVRREAARRGVEITAFWCGWQGPCVWNFYDGQLTLGLVPEAYRFARMETLRRGIGFAAALGVRDVVTHAGFLPENPYDAAYPAILVCIKELVRLCKANGQNFLFESGQETPVTLKRAIQDVEKELGPGNIGVNLDPANLILYGKGNPVDALDVFGEYVRGVHAKDGCYPTDGHSLGEEKPLGQGKVNFPALLARLKQLGYDGDLTIEREITGEQQKKDILAAKKLLEEILESL